MPRSGIAKSQSRYLFKAFNARSFSKWLFYIKVPPNMYESCSYPTALSNFDFFLKKTAFILLVVKN
jgi:hypothetical protein